MTSARFSSNRLVYLDDVYNLVFPERYPVWRPPLLCAEDVLNQSYTALTRIPQEWLFRAIQEILTGIRFPDKKRETECRQRAAVLIGRLIGFPETRLKEDVLLRELVLATAEQTTTLEECASRAHP